MLLKFDTSKGLWFVLCQNLEIIQIIFSYLMYDSKEMIGATICFGFMLFSLKNVRERNSEFLTTLRRINNLKTVTYKMNNTVFDNFLLAYIVFSE